MDRSEKARVVAENLRALGVTEIAMELDAQGLLDEVGGGASRKAEDMKPAAVLRREAEVVAACRKCSLGAVRKHAVYGDGNEYAEIMFIGEAPGAEEDRQGLPFVGRAGQLLNRLLEKVGLNRSDVYICNLLKCRPPENRTLYPMNLRRAGRTSGNR